MSMKIVILVATMAITSAGAAAEDRPRAGQLAIEKEALERHVENLSEEFFSLVPRLAGSLSGYAANMVRCKGEAEATDLAALQRFAYTTGMAEYGLAFAPVANSGINMRRLDDRASEAAAAASMRCDEVQRNAPATQVPPELGTGAEMLVELINRVDLYSRQIALAAQFENLLGENQ